MRNTSLSVFAAFVFGLASSMCITAQNKPNGEVPTVCSPKPAEALYITLESEETGFRLKNSDDSAILSIRVVNCSGDPIEMMARPMVELLRVGTTEQTARLMDRFRGSVSRAYAEAGSSITLDGHGSYAFEIDLNRMKYKPLISSINVWEPFLQMIPSGEFNVTGIIILAKLDSNGSNVQYVSNNHVTVESVKDSLK